MTWSFKLLFSFFPFFFLVFSAFQFWIFAIMWCMYGKKVETSFHSFVYFLWVQVHTLLVYWQSISVTLLLLLIVSGCPLLSLFQWSGLSNGLDTKGKTLPKNTQQVNLVGKNLLKLILTSSYVVLVRQLFVFVLFFVKKYILWHPEMCTFLEPS